MEARTRCDSCGGPKLWHRYCDVNTIFRETAHQWRSLVVTTSNACLARILDKAGDFTEYYVVSMSKCENSLVTVAPLSGQFRQGMRRLLRLTRPGLASTQRICRDAGVFGDKKYMCENVHRWFLRKNTSVFFGEMKDPRVIFARKSVKHRWENVDTAIIFARKIYTRNITKDNNSNMCRTWTIWCVERLTGPVISYQTLMPANVQK